MGMDKRCQRYPAKHPVTDQHGFVEGCGTIQRPPRQGRFQRLEIDEMTGERMTTVAMDSLPELCNIIGDSLGA